MHGTKMARRKTKPQKDDLDAQDREDALYKFAHIYTTMTRDNRGVVGDVARAVGGSLVAPPIDPTHIQRYFRRRERLWGSGRVGVDSHRRHTSERGHVWR